MSVRTSVVACAATGVLVLGACGGPDSPAGTPGASGSGGEVAVVATTTMWADVADQVLACADAGTVESLTPIGADPHDFSPSSQDVVTLVSADLVIANGLGLEEGLESSLDAARADGTRILELAPQLDPMPFGGAADADDHAADDPSDEDHSDQDDPSDGAHSDEGLADADHSDEDHSGDDPHVWMDASRAAKAASLIGAELAELTGDAGFATCGQSVESELEELDREVSSTLSAVPPQRRILVTDHDALEYLATAYGFTVAGTVIPGGSTLAEPSSAELAQLAATVREARVPAVFANTANPQALVDALASEAGDVAVVELYIGSLGPPGSGAETYQGFMATNAQRISDALAG